MNVKRLAVKVALTVIMADAYVLQTVQIMFKSQFVQMTGSLIETSVR